MNKNLRNLLGAIRCKTLLYANMAKEQRTLTILTDYTKPTVKMLDDLRFKGVTTEFFRIKREIDRIYTIEAETEDYIRGENHEAQIEKSN